MTKRMPGVFVNADIILPEEPISEDIREEFWVFTFEGRHGEKITSHVPKEGMLKAYNKYCCALKDLMYLTVQEGVVRARQVAQEFVDWCYQAGCITERIAARARVSDLVGEDAIHVYYEK